MNPHNALHINRRNQNKPVGRELSAHVRKSRPMYGYTYITLSTTRG